MSDLSLLAVFAHPDDESFRPGGTLALLARRGVRVQVLTATRGEAGSCGNPPLCAPDELPALREKELRCACAALGIQPPRLLDYADGHLQEADTETMIEQILSVVNEIKPQVLLSFGPDGLSGHPDHIAVGQWAAEAFRRAGEVAALYTVAVPRSLAETLNMRQVRAVPDEAIALTVDVSPVWETKLAAIRGQKRDPERFYLDDFGVTQEQQPGLPKQMTCPAKQTLEVVASASGKRFQADLSADLCAGCEQRARCPLQERKRLGVMRLSFTLEELRRAQRLRQSRQQRSEGRNLRAAVEATVRSVKHPFPAGKLPVRERGCFFFFSAPCGWLFRLWRRTNSRDSAGKVQVVAVESLYFSLH